MDKIKLRAYGKVNVGLDVLRKREDGYHEVRMIMQTVSLYDKLALTKIEEDNIDLTTNLTYLPEDKENLVYQAILLLKEEFHIKEGILAELKKFIPVSAGMAGGSADAAAALVGMNHLFHLGLTKKELMKRGIRLGADVPYCILRGTALAEGIGEILTPLPPIPDCCIVLAKPRINVSTRLVYEKFDACEKIEHPDIDGMISCLRKKDLDGLSSRMGNVLELVTAREYPIIEEIKGRLLELGAKNALMTGSGPTVFGLFENRFRAEIAREKLLETGIVKQAYVTGWYQRKDFVKRRGKF